MKITPDTNVLVRAIVRDNDTQYQAATTALQEAKVVALTTPALCEFVWVLARLYRIGSRDIAEAIRTIAAASNVTTDEAAVAVGLAALEAGGDFADSVIAYEGRRLDGETFVSFDRAAVKLLRAEGEAAHLLP